MMIAMYVLDHHIASSSDEDDRSCSSPKEIRSPTAAGIQSPPAAHIPGGHPSPSVDEILSKIAADPKYKSDRRISTKGLPIAGKHPAASYSSGGSRVRKEKSSFPAEERGKSLVGELKVPVIKIKPVPPPNQPEEEGRSSAPLSLELHSVAAPPTQSSLVESYGEHQAPVTYANQAPPAVTQTHFQIGVSSHSQIAASSISQPQDELEPNLPPVQELNVVDQSSPSPKQPGLETEKALEDTGASGGEECASPLVAAVNTPDAADIGIHGNEPHEGEEDDILTEDRSDDETNPENTESMKDDEGATQAGKDDIESIAEQSNDNVDVESLDVPFSEARDSPDAPASLRDLSVSDTTDSSAAPSPLPPHSSMQPASVHDINEESRLSFTDNQTSMHHVLDVEDGESPIPRKMIAEKVLLHLSSSSTSSSVSSFSDIASLPDVPLPAEPEVFIREQDKGDKEAQAIQTGGVGDADATAARPVAATPPGLIVKSLGTVTTSPLIVTIKKKDYQKGGSKKKKGQKKRKRDSSPKKTAPAPKRAKLLTEGGGEVCLPSSEVGPTSTSSIPLADDQTVAPVTSVPGLLVTHTSVTTTNASSLFQERDILPKSTPPRRKDSAKQGFTTTTVTGSKMKASAGRISSDKGSKPGPTPSRKKGKKDKTPRSIKKRIKSPSPSRLTVSTSAVKQVSPLVISSLSHTASPGLTVSSKPDHQVTAGRPKPAARGRGKPGSNPKLTVTSSEARSTILFPRSPAKNPTEQDSSSSGSDSNDDDQSDSSSSISMATTSSVGRPSSGL